MAPHRSAGLRAALAAAVLGAGLGAVQPAHAFLDTEKAWNDLLQFAVRQVNAPGEFEIELGQVTRPEDGFARIESLRIRDSDGVWLDASSLLIDWNPSSLLRGRFAFETLSADEINILRAPISRGDPPGESAQIDLAWPRPPVSVVVEKLKIAELAIEGGLLPQDIRAEVEGRFYDLGDIQEATLAVKRLDRPGDTVNLGSRIDFDDIDISFSLEAHEAPGGLVAQLAGLPETEALELTAAAAGDPSSLPFTLYADIGQIGIAEGEGVAQWATKKAVTFNGQVQPGDQTAERWRQALGDSADIRLDAEQTEGGAYRLNTLEIDSNAAALNGKGSVDLEANTIDMAFDWSAKDVGALNDLIAPARVSAVSGSATAVGQLTAPKIDVNAAIRDLKAAFGEIGAVRLRIDSAPEGEGTDSASNVQGFSFVAEAEEMALSDAALQEALGANPTLRGGGAFYGNEDRIALETLTVEAASIDLDGNGEFDIAAGALNAELSGTATKIGPFARAAGLPVDGRANLALKIQNLTSETVERLFLNAQLSQLASSDPTYAALLGDEAVLELLLVEADPGVVAVERGFFESATLAATAKGTVSVPNDTVDLALDWRLNDASRLAQVIAPARLGNANGTARIGDTLSEPKADIDASLTDIAFEGYRAAKAEAAIGAKLRKDRRIPYTIAAEVAGFDADDPMTAALAGPTPRFVASGIYDEATSLLTVGDLKAETAAGAFGFQGDVNLAKRTLAVSYDLKSSDLDAIGAAAGVPLGGSVEAEGAISGSFEAPVVSTRADIREFRFGDYAVEALDLDLSTETALDGAAPFKLDLTAVDPTLPDPGLDALVGRNPSVKAAGSYNPEGPRVLLTELAANLAALDVTASGSVDAAAETFDLEFDLDARELDGLSALVGETLGGAVKAKGRAAGRFTAPEVDVDLDATSLEYGDYSVGAIRGKIDVQQSDTGYAPFDIDVVASDVNLGDPSLNALIGEQAAIKAAGEYNQSAKAVHLDNAAFDTAALTGTAKGSVDLSAQTLDLEYDIDADALGPIGDVAGIELAGSLSAKGKASGRFTAPELDTTLRGRDLRYGEYRVEALDGTIDVAQSAQGFAPFDIDLTASGVDIGDPALNGLIGDAVTLSAAGGFDQSRRILRLDRSALKAGVANAAAKGTVDLGDERLDLEFSLDARALSAFEPLVGEELAGRLRANGTASGSFADPAFDVSLDGQSLRYGPYSIGTIEGRAALSPIAEGDAPFDIDLRASGIGLGDAALEAAIGPTAAIAARGAFDRSAQRIRLDAAQVTTDAVAASAKGTVDLGSQTLDVAFTLDAADLSPATPFTGKPVAGALKASGTLNGPFSAPSIDVTASGSGLVYDRYSLGALDLDLEMRSAPDGIAPFTLSARAAQPRLGDPNLDALLGESVMLDAAGALDQSARHVRIDDATVRAAVGGARLVGNVDLAEQTLDLGYAALLPSLGMLQPVVKAPLGGSAFVDGRLTGPFADPSASGVLTGNGIFYDSYQLGDLNARYDVARLVSGPAGSVSLDAVTAQGPLSLSTAFDLTGGTPRIERLSVNGLGLTLDGNFRSVPGGLYEGEIKLAATDLAPLGALIGQRIAGTADGFVRMSAQGGAQYAVFDLDATDISYATGETPVATFRSVDLRGQIADAFGADPSVDLEADAAQGAVQGFPIQLAELRAKGPLSALNTSLSASGGITGSERVDLVSRLRLVGFPRGGDISSLSSSYQGVNLAAASPFRLTEVQGGGWRAENLNLRLDDGEIVGAGEYTPTGIVANLRFRNVPLQLTQLSGFKLIETGRLEGEINIDTRGAPRGDFNLAATVLRLSGAQLDDPFDLILQGTMDGEALNGRARITSGLIETPFVATARIPLRSVAGSPVPLPDQNASFSVEANWEGDVAEFWAFVPAPDHVLSGPIALNGRASGTLNNPILQGGAVLSGGRYQHLDFGTLLAEMNARADFTQDGRVVFEAAATDGVTGTVQANGSYTVADGTLDAALSLNRAALVRRDDLTAVISGDATAKSAGRGGDLDVAGAFRTDFVELRLIGGYGSSVVVVDAIPVGETAPLYEPPSDDAKKQRVSLDVSLDFPQQVFVRGRGLESEWGGQIRATGYAASPRLNGVIQKRRGWLDLLGRQFELEIGEVRFSGPLDPFIRVRLQREANDLTGWLDVVGPASQLEIDFGSIPALPPDEVLPRLLFGRSKQSLSGLEAAQLAAGVATLMSGEAGALDTVRGALGVDVLRVDGDDEAGTSVSTGKYLAPGVFVGAKQNLTTGQSAAIVEIEVFENIEIEAELGAEEQKASGSWKLDY